VNENVLIGGGGGVLYGRLDMELFAPPLAGTARAELDGDDVVGIWNVGVLFEISEKTRIGATYWSDMELDFDGDLKVDRRGIDVDVNTKIKYPQFIRLGVYHELSEDWDLLASVRWEDWSEMDEVLLSGESREAALARNWDDTWHVALGARYRLCDGWTLSAGVAYDTSPVESYDRTADMPVDRQIRINTGASFKYSEELTLGASLEYLDLGDAAIKSSLLKGDYSSYAAIFLGVNAWWKW
jgi:long-chain fatty acid transport protein